MQALSIYSPYFLYLYYLQGMVVEGILPFPFYSSFPNVFSFQCTINDSVIKEKTGEHLFTFLEHTIYHTDYAIENTPKCLRTRVS